MKYIRVIPRLDIKGPNLVKGVHLEGLRVLGNPSSFAKYYFENGADELHYQDVVASLYNRNSILDFINKTANEIFIPLTVGGGIRSSDDIKTILRAGADKVSINTQAIKQPDFINSAARIFGSSTIVLSIEASRNKNGDYYAYTDNGREFTGKKVIDWATEVEERGAGEIFVTSIDKEGTGLGFDTDLIKILSENLKIPIIAHGGAGEKKHCEDIIKKTNVDSICFSSILHYNALKKIKDNVLPNEGNTNYLFNKTKYKNFGQDDILSIKNYLNKNNINVRLQSNE